MEDVPQPAGESYEPGDRVQVYLSEDDPDAHHHGRVYVIEERITDSLAEETGRQIDSILYRVRDTDTGETLDIDFRHRDLVPAPDE